MAWTFGPLLQEGYGITVEANAIKTSMETGPQRIRRISSKTETILQTALFVANNAEKNQFFAYWEDEANQGVDWVEVPLLTKNVEVNHTVRLGKLSVAPAGLGWKTNMTIEVRDLL